MTSVGLVNTRKLEVHETTFRILCCAVDGLNGLRVANLLVTSKHSAIHGYRSEVEPKRFLLWRLAGKSSDLCVRRREFEISTANLRKGTRGMSWRQETKKGVEVCEKPGEADKQAMIPGSLNAVN